MTQHIALIKNGVVDNVIVADMDFAQSIECDAVVAIDGLSPAPGVGWSYNGATFTAPPQPVTPNRVITNRAFQARFPSAGVGVATKFDLMTLFLQDDGYATTLVSDAAQRYMVRANIITGLNRLNGSNDVDLDDEVNGAPPFIALMSQSWVPVNFRLTAAEGNAILNNPVQAGET